MNRIHRAAILSIVAIATLTIGSSISTAQTDNPKTIDCSLDGGKYTCNRLQFLKAFAEAHTVAVDSQPRNPVSDKQLTTFATQLAKQPVPAGQPADMLLRVVRNQPTGFSVGPGDEDLATLRVFSTKTGNASSHLLWVETYTGQPDLPWAVIVRALTQQLQSTIAGH
jgi:hypothetical protein